METVGIIGGLGPESTVDYYQRIIREFKRRTGKNNNPSINIVSLDIVEILSLVEQRNYAKLIEILSSAIDRLRCAGSDFAVISSNTPHVVFEELQQRSRLDLISIVDASCEKMHALGYRNALLTGTLFTMRENFYGRNASKYGVDIIVPDEDDKRSIHDVIFPELEDGIIVPEKKAQFIELVTKYVRERGAESVILGCTELPLMIAPNDLPVPSINTSAVHVDKIVDRMLRGESR